jgi:GT2 family glycosyltransferase
MQSPKIAVVILNWNGKDFLEKFLPGVIQHSPEGSVYVADNCSSDTSVEFVKSRFPDVHIVINKENGGFAKGYNDALKHIEAGYYVLLNSDVEVTANWINPIIQLMETEKKIAACQPKILAFHAKDHFEYAGASGGFMDTYGYPFCRGRIFDVLEEDKGQYDSIMEIFWATGACMFVRADIYKEMQGFDEDYFAHMEEIDLCWRMKNNGYKIFAVPSSVVYHVGGGTLNKTSPRKTFLNFRNNLITYTKNYAGSFLFMKLLYRMILDGVAAFKFLLSGEGRHFISVLKAHFAFYGSISKTLEKRRTVRTMPSFAPSSTGMLHANIVVQHYLKGKKKFSEIKNLF